MSESTSRLLRDAVFRHREHRILRLQHVLSGWQQRQAEIEILVMDSFQAQDLDKIAILLTEKKWLERRIVGLTGFLDVYSVHE